MTGPWVWAATGGCAAVIFWCALHQRRPLRTLLAGALCGLGALALVALLAPATGVELPLNRFTAFVAAVLGLPGVVTLLLLQLLL